MIRIDADLYDMTVTDLADTLPIIDRDIAEWTNFGQKSMSADTIEICNKKVRYLKARKVHMEHRLASLQLVSE
jgi:hypothetical protein